MALPVLIDQVLWKNRYVPHANRALRSFNMFLNVRRPPLRSKFYWNPLPFFFPRPVESQSAPRSPSPPSHNRQRSTSAARPIPHIPPAANPRGELIFSSRIDRNFRESYERYRSAFERKREEKEYTERHKKWYGHLLFWERPPSPACTGVGSGAFTPTRVSSVKGTGSRSGTPPMPGISGSGMKQQRDRSGSPMRRGDTPRERGLRRDRDSGMMGVADMRTVVLEKTISEGGTQH